MKSFIYFSVLAIIGLLTIFACSTLATFIWDDIPTLFMFVNCFITYEVVVYIKPILKKRMKIE